uniref:CSON009359 protein n=1 Tax=Culicoides sonorensis TaxID=179676 RepID=A0A336LK26_CULSO
MLTEHQQREFAEKANALKLQKQKLEAAASTSPAKKSVLCSVCCSFQDNLGANEYRKDRRLHGFQSPLHPLQVAGWVAILIFGCASFLLLIPVLPIIIQPVVNGCLAAIFCIHIIAHIAAVIVDPADKELRKIRTRQVVPEFDRAKHAHVIENGRCHLCNIKTTSTRTKHCSVCNKCVGKWLNHCIGGRNYVAFLMCVLSAVIAVLVILAACIAEITIYYFKPEWLNIWTNSSGGNLGGSDNSDVSSIINNEIGLDSNDNNNTTTTIINEILEQVNTTLINNLTNVVLNSTLQHNGTLNINNEKENLGLGINGTIFVIFAATVGLLAAISAGLLLHLCFFHVYISYLGLTTYEYIRQQRTSNVTFPPALYQQKNGTHKNVENGISLGRENPSQSNGTKNNNSNKRLTSFFRSKSAEADFYFCSSVNPLESEATRQFETTDIESQNRPKTLYCCDHVESHHHRHKAYYMCSVMEENPLQNSIRDLSRINYYPDDEAQYESKTFHCCSEFVETSTDNHNHGLTHRELDQHAIGTVSGILEQSRREAFLHYTEQCTFCSFRIKTPAKRHNIALEDKQCCIKTVAKHHRWRRKWNCCSNVPDSPDVPMGISNPINVPQIPIPSTVLNVRSLNNEQSITNHDQRNNNSSEININSTFENEHQQQENSANNNIINTNGNNNPSIIQNSPNNNTQIFNTNNENNGDESDIQQIITISSSLSNVSSSSTTTIMPPSTSSSNNGTPSKRMRVRGIRPVIRLRHMFRVLGKRYRRPRCRHGPTNSASVQVKQNQIRPLPGQTIEKNTNLTTINQQQQESNNGQYSTITHQTILPTSAIRNETIVTTYQQQKQLYTLPALPPPQRRKIRTNEDIQDLADTLAIVQQNIGTTTTTTPSTIIRLSTPNVNNCNNNSDRNLFQHHNNRRHSRRKQILRPRSPTLSPIHESGLSNPTSPLPCHRQNSGETPEDEEDDNDISNSISSLNNAHLSAKLNVSPNLTASPNKRCLKV